jgi:hypothetical protein
VKNLGDMAKRFIQQEIEQLQSHPQSQQQGYPPPQQPYAPPPQGYAPQQGYPPAPGYEGYTPPQQGYASQQPGQPGAWQQPQIFGGRPQPYAPGQPPQSVTGSGPVATGGFVPPNPYFTPNQQPGYAPQGYAQQPYPPQAPQQGGGLLGGAGGGLLAGLAGGVAGGLAGEAIGNALFGHHNPVMQQPEEVIVNNYYEQPAQGYHGPDNQPADFSNTGFDSASAVDTGFDTGTDNWSGGPDGCWSDGSDSGGNW